MRTFGPIIASLALSCAGPTERPAPPAPVPASPSESPSPPVTAAAVQSASAAAATATATASPDPPSSAPCPEDMVLAGKACVDRFEAPNRKGERPLLMQTVKDGDAWCAERGKRLCTEDEWVRACEGPSRRPFPYGAKFVSGTCNDEGKFLAPSWKILGGWPSEAAKAEVSRLDQSEPSGQRAGCVSEEGVFDLTGNVAEWVLRTKDNETNHSHVVKGCFWGRCFRPPHTPSCEYVNFAHPAGYRSYEMGFRCCKAPAVAK